MNESSPPREKHRPIGPLSGIFLLSAIAAIALMLFMRATAPDGDFAIANALTALLTFSAWLLASIGLWLSGLPRGVWRLFFALPMLAIASFFAIYKVKRLDGDITPHFTYRWGSDTELPAVEQSTASEEVVSWLVARRTDYPQYLGPNRDGVLTDTLLADDWQASPPQILWKQSIGSGWSSFSIQGDVAVTMEQRDEEEWVTAYHVSSGQMLWKFALPGKHFNVMGGVGPRSTPTIHDGKVYACSAVSRLVCLDLATGTEVWNAELLNEPQEAFEASVAWGRSGSPLVVNGMVIVPQGGNTKDSSALVGFDVLTGEQRFSAGPGIQISYSSPMLAVLDGVEQLVYTSENHLNGFHLETGDALWQIEAPGASNGGANISQPVVIDSTSLLITKGYGQGARRIAVEKNGDGVWTAKETWATPSVLKTKFTSCVLHDGYAYGLSDGILECVDVESGKRAWKRGRYRQGQLLLVGEHLVISSEAGELVLVEATPKEHNELGKIQVIGDVSWNTTALSGNRLLMRNADEVACVILPVASEPAMPRLGEDTSETAGTTL